ncbi:uncharacterized protein LOC133530715 [Cydia pomonella]|uniref:uncharacterized protein LOC133530715 n=1 Tax=Cydia pomonella TaxID=82600 RepID=UPI002ADD7741|nr:uncharacterized protein LOC133530715 [Cydia pomonella]
MPNPKKTEENPCEIDVNCTGKDKPGKTDGPCEVKIEKTENEQKESHSKKTAKNLDNEQARINKESCSDLYTPPACEKERTIPPNPRKNLQKKKTDDTDDKTTKDAKDPCAENPCFKTQEDPKDKEEKKPC